MKVKDFILHMSIYVVLHQRTMSDLKSHRRGLWIQVVQFNEFEVLNFDFASS